ncbi:arginine--tRNA ligase [Candidatus Uhrbacteria bacterium]|nr:arginine--tRNA ligase [Candidatus Uhrbacteria bacterium]
MVLDQARQDIISILEKARVEAIPADLVFPPDPQMGDLSLPLFALSKERKVAPGALAQELTKKLKPTGLVKRVEAAGPYINFFLDTDKLTKQLFDLLKKEGADYGKSSVGQKKKYLVEFSCANPMKAFHLGHLRNTVTGESVSRILENAGYKVVRVNYQGDVGMHIAKSLWGIFKLQDAFKKASKKSVDEQVEFLGRAYAHGAKAFETDERAKQEILEINKKVYARDKSIQKTYTTARDWSLKKFETIYKRLDTHFDEYYFESEMWKRGMEIVKEFFKKGVFKKGDGAIIFPGSAHGLHDRVFITTEGNATYEAKDLALSEKRHKKHHPDMIIHVVGKEQTEYFKVVFKALEYTLPNSKGREFHLPGGFLQLKEGKMSSRTGNVVLAEQLLDDAEIAVKEIMKNHEVQNRKEVIKIVADAAVKYAILRNHVSADTLFDMKESVSLSGDSGPYLLYIVARIKSILRKAKGLEHRAKNSTLYALRSTPISASEHSLIMSLARFPEVNQEAAAQCDPSRVAHYLFSLAQTFNAFYNECPVLQAEGEVKKFRLFLIQAVLLVMTQGLSLLGIETVEEM